MAAQEWIYGLTLYFIGIAIVVSLFSLAGAFTPSQFSTHGGYNPQQAGSANFSNLPTGVTSTFSMGKFFKDIFSFFVFNISIGNDGSIIYQYLWLIRIIFVYIPVTFLVIAIWYSLPTIGG